MDTGHLNPMQNIYSYTNQKMQIVKIKSQIFKNSQYASMKRITGSDINDTGNTVTTKVQ